MVDSTKVQAASNSNLSSNTLGHAPPNNPQPSHFLNLPVDLRTKILNLAITTPHDYWLDRRVFGLYNSILSPSRKRFWSFVAAPGATKLLCVNKQIRREVQEILFTSFAFFSFSWHLVADSLQFPDQLEFFSLREIRHLVFMTQVPSQLKHEQVTVTRLLSALPKLESVRVMVTSSTTIPAVNQQSTEACSDYIVQVALLFRGVGQVSVIGQDLVYHQEKIIVRDARRRLREMRLPWYRELHLNYLPCRNRVLLTHEEHAAVAFWYYPPVVKSSN
ncbi:hypothetical protein PHISCL_03046 [Aspergillus sclerotialis]|uniref:F-box domain-containing protein n=1 Tax=Aspergillus sclerotialis TaxID=2070753 RepID=A0A3A2ZN79_9EURO|nr:hypothetical protein PHISCL_03046 [Aspergillus sclerotialis]